MATMRVVVRQMKMAQISQPGAGFQIVEREVPEPGEGQVRIKVQACGICHSDVLTAEGSWPGIQYPRVPGHEVAGIIDEVGPVSLRGRRGSVLASAGTAARTTRVASADGEIFVTAAT